jgi:hypothetical protein
MADYRSLLTGPPPGAQPPPEYTPKRTNYADALLGTSDLEPQAKTTPPGGQPQRQVPWGESAAQGFLDTAMLGYADEAEAALGAGAGKVGEFFGMQPGPSYDERLAAVRERQANAPMASYAPGAVAGLVAPGLGLAGLTGRAATTAGKYGIAAGAGAAEGAVASSGAADGTLGDRAAAVPGGALAGALGGVAGQKLGSLFKRVAERGVADDIARLNSRDVGQLRALAKKYGVQLTPAELTNLSSLKSEQKILGNIVGSAGDDLQDFYRTRSDQQIEPAIRRFMGSVSDFGGDAADERVRAASRAGMQEIAENRAAQAAPIYQRAFEAAPSVDVKPLLDKIEGIAGKDFPETGGVAGSLSKLRKLITQEGVGSPLTKGAPAWTKKDARTPMTSLKRLHGAKLELDDMIEAATANADKGSRTQLAKLTELKTDLLKAMDEASPEYQSARSIFSDLSPGLDKVREGVAGQIASLQDRNLRLAAGKLFGPKVRASDAAEAKRVIQKADPEAWQAIKRSYLEDAWTQASQENLGSAGTPTNAGAKFRKSLMGNADQLAVLQKVLEPDEMKALNELSQVLEASGRVKGVGSDTAYNLEAMERVKEKSTGLLSRIMQAASFDAVKEAGKRLQQRDLHRHANKMVATITSPQGMELMRELKRITPNQQLRRDVLGYALGIGAANEIEITD